MVALTESAPPPCKSRAQRRREQRQASRAPGGAGFQPASSVSSGGTGVPPVSPPSQSKSFSPCLPPRLRASAVRTPSPRDALIADYLNDAFALPELAARHNLSIPELCDILDSPEFTALLERLTRLAEKRASDIATHTRAGALSTLETVCATATNPETARKAATALIRASDRVLYPTKSRAARATDRASDPSAPSAPEGPRHVATGEASPRRGASETRGNHASDSTSPRRGEGSAEAANATGGTPVPLQPSESRSAAA